MKCSGAFVHRFRFENHWQLLQHLDRRSQAEQSKIAGIAEIRLWSAAGEIGVSCVLYDRFPNFLENADCRIID